jgi:hypothetical protein
LGKEFTGVVGAWPLAIPPAMVIPAATVTKNLMLTLT